MENGRRRNARFAIIAEVLRPNMAIFFVFDHDHIFKPARIASLLASSYILDVKPNLNSC